MFQFDARGVIGAPTITCNFRADVHALGGAPDAVNNNNDDDGAFATYVYDFPFKESRVLRAFADELLKKAKTLRSESPWTRKQEKTGSSLSLLIAYLEKPLLGATWDVVVDKYLTAHPQGLAAMYRRCNDIAPDVDDRLRKDAQQLVKAFKEGPL